MEKTKAQASSVEALRYISRQPWAILPEALSDLCYRVAEGVLFDEQLTPLVAGRVGSTAVISIQGVIVPKSGGILERWGWVSSTERIGQQVDAAVKDEKTKAILFDIDSPGGIVYGVQEVAAKIRTARDQKPIAAIANPVAASAAIHIGSQAHEFYVTPSGEAGSIGVFAAHQDWSKFDEQMGIKTTLISAGKYKTEFNPYEPLSEEAREFLQGEVNKNYQVFVQDVAKGRGVTPEKVRKDFGEGRMLMAQDAVRAGLADRVLTMDQALARLAGPARARMGKREESYTVRDFEHDLRSWFGLPYAAAKEIAKTEFMPDLRDEAGNDDAPDLRDEAGGIAAGLRGLASEVRY